MENFGSILSMLTKKQEQVQDKKLISIKPENIDFLLNEYIDYPKQIKEVFQKIFNNKFQMVIYSQILPFQTHQTVVPVCNKLFGTREQIYRCYDCLIHEAAVYCRNCFQNGNHKGHRYDKTWSSGGNCDCGNFEAIREGGFCKDHKGIVDQSFSVDQKQMKNFLFYLEYVVRWIEKMFRNERQSQASVMMLHFVKYLDHLNTNSLYYNTMTTQLLFSNDNRFVQLIFEMGVKQNDNLVAKLATNFFLKMFNLDSFKIKMCVSFLKAYNLWERFQKSSFESLFIQLFANNEIVEETFKQKDTEALDPRNRKYDSDRHFNNIMFVASIKQQSAAAFYKRLITNGTIHFDLLEIIQQKCEKGQFSVLQICGQYLNHQNNYHSVVNAIIKILKNDKESLELMICNYYKQIKKYSFQKNHIILTYQRIFFELIFARFGFDINSVETYEIIKIIGITQEEFKIFLRKTSFLLLQCLKDLARTQVSPNLFQIYTTLYLRAGNRLVIHDSLALKICAFCFYELSCQEEISKILMAMYQTENSQNDLPQKFEKWMNLLSIVAEITYSNSSEIHISHEFEVDSPKIKSETKQFLKSILLSIKEISIQGVQKLKTYYINTEINKSYLSEMATYDKAKKKYIIKESLKGSQYPLQILNIFHFINISIFPKQYEERKLKGEFHMTQKVIILREVLFSTHMLEAIIMDQLRFLCSYNEGEFEKRMSSFTNAIKIFFPLIEDKSLISNLTKKLKEEGKGNEILFQRIDQIFIEHKQDSFHQAQKNKQELEKKKALLKKKKQQRMFSKKILQNQAKILNEQQFSQQESTEDAEQCIVCHQGAKKAPLNYLSRFHYSSLLLSMLKLKGRCMSFKTCFHLVHFKCFVSLTEGKQFFSCPLCKSLSNIVLETQFSLYHFKEVEEIRNRIDFLRVITFNQVQQTTSQVFKTPFAYYWTYFIELACNYICNKEFLNDRKIQEARVIYLVTQEIFKGWKVDDEEFLQTMYQKFQVKNQTHYDFTKLFKFLFMLMKELMISKEKNMQQSNQCKKILIQAYNGILKQQFQAIKELFERILKIKFPNISYKQIEQNNLTPLPHLLKFYEPPKTVQQLLKQRDEKQNLCKQGHNICVCIVCNWQGCIDCKEANEHSLNNHHYETLFLNLNTGGFYYYYKNYKLNVRSFYVDEIGKEWLPKYDPEQFNFQEELYVKLIEALKNSDVLKFLIENFDGIKGQFRQTLMSI